MEVLAGTPCTKENGVMDITLRREIEELRGACIAQIRARYREVFEEEPRSKHREQLLRRLVWRLAGSRGRRTQRSSATTRP